MILKRKESLRPSPRERSFAQCCQACVFFLIFTDFVLLDSTERSRFLRKPRAARIATFCSFLWVLYTGNNVSWRRNEGIWLCLKLCLRILRDKNAPSLLWSMFYVTEIYLRMRTIVLRNMIFFVRIFPRFFTDDC